MGGIIAVLLAGTCRQTVHLYCAVMQKIVTVTSRRQKKESGKRKPCPEKSYIAGPMPSKCRVLGPAKEFSTVHVFSTLN